MAAPHQFSSSIMPRHYAHFNKGYHALPEYAYPRGYPRASNPKPVIIPDYKRKNYKDSHKLAEVNRVITEAKKEAKMNAKKGLMLDGGNRRKRGIVHKSYKKQRNMMRKTMRKSYRK